MPLATLVTLVPFMYEIALPKEASLRSSADIWREMFQFISHDGVYIPMFYLYVRVSARVFQRGSRAFQRGSRGRSFRARLFSRDESSPRRGARRSPSLDIAQFFNLCFVSNPGWSNFLYLALNFTNFEFGMLGTVASLLGAAGLWAYEQYFARSRWRFLYLWTSLLGGLFSVLQICLVTGNTAGIPKYLFALGDTAFASFVGTISFMCAPRAAPRARFRVSHTRAPHLSHCGGLSPSPSLARPISRARRPMCIMFFPMVPPGTEGTTYALISTWQNVASSVATNLGTSLACFANVSDSAIENHNYRGMLKLTVLTSLVQFVPIFFIYGSWRGVRFLPDSMEESKDQIQKHGKSDVGGALFMLFFFGSIAASLFESFYVIADPNAC